MTVPIGFGGNTYAWTSYENGKVKLFLGGGAVIELTADAARSLANDLLREAITAEMPKIEIKD